jgi:hypothetical protein
VSNKTVQSIVCDYCGAELIQHTSYPARYSLQLTAIDTNINDTGMEYACGVTPPIKGPLHFCNIACLNKWCKSNTREES